MPTPRLNTYICTYTLYIMFVNRNTCSSDYYARRGYSSMVNARNTSYIYPRLSPEVFMTVIVNIGHTRRLNRNIICICIFLFVL